MSDFNISNNSLMNGMSHFSGSDKKLNMREFNSMMNSMEGFMKKKTGFDDGIRSTASEKAMMFDIADLDGDGKLNKFEQRMLADFFTGGDGNMNLDNWWNVKNRVY